MRSLTIWIMLSGTARHGFTGAFRHSGEVQCVYCPARGINPKYFLDAAGELDSYGLSATEIATQTFFVKYKYMGAPKDGRIGIWMTSALVVGTMIGAGIFMLPVSLAPLGGNALVGWFLSSVGALTIAFALARLSQLGGDGIQANIERQLGRNVAFLVAWSFWVSNLAAQAAVAIAGASALSWINPALAGPGFVIPAAIGSVAFFTAVNAFGVRASGVASIVTVVIRLLPLAGVILIFALRGIGSSAYEALAPMALTPGNIATATALTFFALTGFENATTPVDKVRDPARTVPRAIIGGTLFVAIVYFLASTSLQMLLPAAKVAGSPAPFADAIAAQWGEGAASLAALAIAIAAF